MIPTIDSPVYDEIDEFMSRFRPNPSAKKAELVARIETFANPCHKPEGPGGGQFCETEGTLEKAPAAEQAKSRQLADEKIALAVQPSRSKVRKVRAQVRKARAEGKRVENRGNTEDRRRRSKNLFTEFGGDERGYIVCPVTGVKMHYTSDPKENPKGYPVLSEDKIWTTNQGGTYTMDNVLPVLLSANMARSNKPLRKGNQ